MRKPGDTSLKASFFECSKIWVLVMSGGYPPRVRGNLSLIDSGINILTIKQHEVPPGGKLRFALTAPGAQLVHWGAAFPLPKASWDHRVIFTD